MTNGLTPDQEKELIKQLTAYANEGATDEELRDFRNAYIEELKKKGSSQPSVEESTEPQKQPTTPSASPTPKAPLPSTSNELLYTGALGGLKRNEPIAGIGKPLKQKQEPIDVTYTPEEMPSETTERATPQGVRQFGQRAKEAEKQISKGQLPTDPQFVNDGTISKVEENRKKLGLSTLDESFESAAKQRKEAEKFDKYEYDSRDINSLEKIFGKSKDEVVYNLENLKFTPEWGPLYNKYTKGLETIVPGWDPESGLGGIASSGLRSKAKDFIYQNYLNDYNILKNDVDSQGIKIKNDISTKISDYFAKNDPSQYMKDAETLSAVKLRPDDVLPFGISSVKTGEKVVDMDKVNKLAEEMMSKSGQSTDFGYVRDLIIDAIKTDVNQEIIKPEAEKLLKGERAWATSQPLKEIITSPSFIYNEAKKEYQEATGKAWDENKQNVDITAKTRLKLDSEYKNIEQSAKSEQDALLKEYERLVELAKQQGTEAPNPDIINEKIAQINTKYEQRWQRSQDAILEKANIELEAAYKKFTEGLNIDPSIQQKFEKAYSLAYSEAAKNRDNRLDVAVADKGLPMAQFARTYMTALGGSLKGYGAAFDNQTLKDFGNALEQNFYLAPAEIDGWNSLLEGEGILGNFQKLNGMLAGSMTTSLTASTLAAVTTGGTGVLPAISASITGFLAESAEMAGRAKQEMFLKTGSISKANKAYEDTWRAQYNIAGLYAFEGIPFIGKAIRGIGSKGLRIGLGAGVEYVTEVPQEFTQGIYEENIAAGLDPWDSFYEKTNPFGDSEAAKIARKRHEENLITLTPTLITGGAGQIRSTSEKTDAINAYAAMTAKEDMASQLPDLKSQWLQNLYQSKGGKFTSGVLASMHQAGQITTEQFGELNTELERVKNTIETATENGITKKGDINLFSFLSRQSKAARQNADKYANSNPGLSKFWEEKAKEYDQQSADFLNGKTPNVFTVTFADGSQSILSEYEAKMMAKSDSFLGALENGSVRIESYRNDQKEFMDGLRSSVDSRRQNISNLTQGIVSEVGVSDASKVEKMVMSHPNYNSMTPGQKASLSFKLKELATLVEQAKSEPKAGQEQNIERVKKELADILDYKKTPKSQKETIAQANKFDRELYVLNEKKNKFFSPRISQLMNENKMSRADAAAQAETEWRQTEDGKRELALQEERKKLDAVARGYVLQDPSSVPLEITTSEIIEKPTDDKKDQTGLPSQVGEGQKPIETQPLQGAGAETTETSGVLQAPKEEITPPTQEQILDDIKNKRLSTFTYNNESEVPDNLKSKISSTGEINGKPFVKVTLAQSEAEYELAKANQAQKEATPTTEAAPEEVTLKNGVKVTPTKISGQTKFFHASPKKREGRLRPNEAPQWGKAIYFATNKKSATDEFGGDNVTEASLNLKNPVYTNTKEFKDVEKKAAELYNREMLPEILKDEAELVNGKWRFFDEDLQAEYDKNGYIDKYSSSDIEEGKYFGQAAKELGYDAIIDEGNQYGSEIAVLDENAVIYPEDIELKESPQATTVSEVVEEKPAPKPQTTEETTQAQMEFPEPTERNDENINALLEKKRKYNSLPKKSKPLATNLLNEIRSMAKDMGIEVTFAAGFEIRLTDKKTGKNITKRGVDRTVNKDRNQVRQAALSAAGDGMLGMYARVMLWFRSGGKILTSQSELGENTREMKDAKKRGYIGDDGASAEMAAEQLVEDVLGVDPERASEYVYDNDIVSLFQDFLAEYGSSSKEDIENGIIDIYLRNAEEQNEEAKGRFEMEYGKGALGFLNQDIKLEEIESKIQEGTPRPKSTQSSGEDSEFSFGGREPDFRRVKGPTERGEAVSGTEAVKMVENFLKASGINVRVLNDKDFDTLLGKKGYSVDADGVFMTNDNTGEVLIRRSSLESKYGDVIVFHEGIHPVINIIRNTDPKLYNAIVQGIKNEAKTNKKIQGIISEVERVMEGEPAPAVEDEIVTEVFSRIASGDVKLSEIKKSLAEKIIYYANKIAKLLGLNKRIGINPSDIEFRDFANGLTNALRQGGSITDVVGRGREKDFIKDYAEKLSIQPSRIFYVRSLTNISKFKANKNYQQAKAGDSKSAEKLINETLTKDHEDKIKKITSKYPDAEIVPVRKLKETGTNRIPNALAQKVVEIGGGNLNLDIVQYGESSRTTQGKAQRFFERPDFQGKVEKGKKYILVDDAFATGGTIKSLKDYIEDNGGDVVNVIVLGAGRAGTKFEPTKLDKRILLGIYGEKNLNTLLELSGRNSIENLTKDEIDFLKNFESVDRVLAKELAERIKYATDKIYINNEKTKDGRTITTNQEGSFISESGNVQYSRRGIVRGEKDKGGSADTTVKNVWNQYKGIKFNGSLKIEDASDVAHIMRQLENKAVEHAFAVHVDKNGKPHIQFLGMGGVASTTVDKTLILAGAKRYNSKKIYLVHNHPSGSMTPSSHDISLTNDIREMFAGLKIPIEHVILDTYKKEFVHIDINGYPSVSSRDERKEADEKYLRSLKTEMMDEFEVLSAPLAKVTSSRDTAQFFTQMRFTALPKNGMLVMNRQNHVIGNYILPGGFNYKDVTDNMVGAGVGQSVIFYSNQDNYKDIDSIKKGLEAAGISVLDYILVDSNSQSVNDFYKSYADEGLLRETQQEYGTTPVEKQKAQFSRKMDRDMAVTPSGETVKTKPLPEGLAIINGFYSPIEKNLMEYGKDKIKAKDWLNVVGKGDEAVFTGVRAFLEGKDPNAMVSKQEILDYMKDNRISVVEVVKSDEPKMSDDKARDIFENQGYDVVTDNNGDTYVEKDDELYEYDDMSPLEQEAFEVLTRGNLDTGRQKETKHSPYQLEGEKENYKEVLVTLPSRYSAEERIRAEDKGIMLPADNKKTIFQSTHFDEPNILVHLRMNTRTDADGKKVLFLEEIQSDWGQTGKKEGFKDIQKENKIRSEWDKLVSKESLTINEKNRLAELDKQLEPLLNSKTPTAPFVMDTNAWTKLGLKVALKEAVAQGVDKIAWTTGTQQFDRWGTEKIDWVTTMKPKGGSIVVKDTNKAPIIRGRRTTNLASISDELDPKKEIVRIAEKWGLQPSDLEYQVTTGRWTINIQEQFQGTAFEGMNVDKEAITEKGTAVTSKEDLKAAIDRTLSREKTETERQKLTDRIWDRMQKEDSGTSLPRKEGMESFYGTEGTKGIVGGVAEKLSGQELGETKIEIQEQDVKLTENEFDISKAPKELKDLLDKYEEGIADGDYAELQKFSKEAAEIGYEVDYDLDGTITTFKRISGKPKLSTQPSIDITPEIKAEVLRGQAQFSRKMSRDLSEEERSQSLEGVKTEMARIEDSISEGADPQTAYDELFATQDYADISMDLRMKVNAAIKRAYPNVTTAENIARGLTESYEKKEAKVADVLRNDRDLAYIYRNFPSIIDQLKENKVIEIEGDCV